MDPKFNNKPNPLYKIDGKDIWQSRSVAIVMICFFYNKDNRKTYVVIEKRSNIMDDPGKWCLPCGYIDWDESGWDCGVREVFEETGLYIPSYYEFLVYDNNKEPIFVNTNPGSERQNISLCYGLEFSMNDKDFPYEIENFKNPEIDCIKLVDTDDIKK